MRRRKHLLPHNLLTPSDDSPPLLPDPVLKRLILRVMVTLGGSKRLLGRECYNDDNLAIFLGLPILESEFGDDNPYSLPEAQGRLRKLLAASESETVPWTVNPVLKANSHRLANLMGLDALEQKLLEFAVVLHNHRFLADACDYLDGLPNQRLMHVLSVLLDASPLAMRTALAPKGRLASSGLLTVDVNNNCTLVGKLDLLSDQFCEQMITELDEPAKLLRGMILPCSQPELGLVDYPHLAESLDILQPYLRAVIHRLHQPDG
jgi:transitional endoplasmic reticulum ATPase